MKAIVTLLSGVMALSGMTAHAENWTLQSCIDYAVEHNLTVKQRAVDIKSQELGVTSAKSAYLPNLSANVGQSWNIGRGLTAENTYANRNTSNFQWGASLNVPIFNGMQTPRQVSYQKANLATVIEQFEAAKEDITLNVITAYLQVLYTQELHDVALQQVDLSTYELTRQEALLEAGKIPEVDMLSAKSQLAQDEYNAARTANDVHLAKLDLAQLLELTDPENMTVEPLNESETKLLPASEVYEQALYNNHQLRAARNNITAQDRNIALAKTGYIPSLSFNAGIGSSYYKISGFDNESFGQQMKNNYSTYFGFSLNIPIFDAFSTRNSVNRAKVQKINAQLQYDEAQLNLFKAIQQAYYQADGAQQKLTASIVADETAQKTFEAMREKYNLGRATPQEYEQAKTKALNATSERIQAQYELILRARILRFYAKQN